MSILWFAAGEEIEFGFRATGVVSDPGGSFRNTYTRAGLALPQSLPRFTGKLADGLPLVSPITSGWLSGQYYNSGNNTPDPSFGLANSGVTLGGIFVGQATVSNQKLAIFSLDDTGTYTELDTEVGTTYTGNALHRIDMQITDFNTVSTNIKVYLNLGSTPLIDWTGDTTGLGFTDLDCVRLLSGSNGSTAFISEVIIADEDTRAFVAVVTLAPNAAGTTNTFDTGDYTDIDEIVLDDADMITSGSIGQIFECNLNDLPTGDFAIKSVKVCARASKGGTGPGTLKLGVDSGGTDNSVDETLTTALTSYDRIMGVNPVTTNPWTTAEVNALQAFLESDT